MNKDKSNRSVTTVNLDDDLAEWMSEQNINRSDYINEAVRMRKEGEQRMEEVIRQKEIERVQSEIRSRQSELEALKEERKKDRAWSAADLQDAKEALQNTPRDVTNPAIQKKAKDLGMTPQELIDELEGDDE